MVLRSRLELPVLIPMLSWHIELNIVYTHDPTGGDALIRFRYDKKKVFDSTSTTTAR
jgi:hypothetical protein